MKVFIAFLLTSFVIGGYSLGQIPRRRTVLFAVCCMIVGLSFLSLRVIE
jgi:hypothetical protein